MPAIQAVLPNNQGVLFRDEKRDKGMNAKYPVLVTRAQLSLMFDLLTMLNRSDRGEVPRSEAADYLHRCSCRACANEVANRVISERYGGKAIHTVLEEEDGHWLGEYTYSNSGGCKAKKNAKDRNFERLKQVMRKMGMVLRFRRDEKGPNEYEHWFSVHKVSHWLKVTERLLDSSSQKKQSFRLRKREEVYWEFERPLGLNLINDRIGVKAKAGELIFGVSRKLSWEQFMAKQAKKKAAAV